VDAIPLLLRRLVQESGLHSIQIARAFRSTRGQLCQEETLKRVIEVVRLKQPDGILITLDSDDDCPVELAEQINAWAKKYAAPLACEVAIAHREFEAWFLSSVESLRGKRGIALDATSENNPESFRGAKAKLEGKMMKGNFYSETADQATLTASLDLARVYKACRSFRRLTSAFAQITRSAGTPLLAWPPPDWL
jgi:hypothetical protein